jgi:enoyl-CoA hydratase/carnithine racemase
MEGQSFAISMPGTTNHQPPHKTAVSSFFLPRLIGTSRAMHLTTTGSVYPADHALFGHLFSETLPTPEATVARALELADEVAKNTSTISTKLMRDLMYRGPPSAEEAHLLDSRYAS